VTAAARGMISFVGAGPGAPDLITLRGADRLARADVVIWASSLVPEALLQHAGTAAEVHDSAVMTLEDVLEVYAAHAEGRIVRLHSGDPAIYGAIQEQIDWCTEHERDFEIVPGVSSLAAGAAALARELTVPRLAQSVVITRLPGKTSASMPERETLAAFAAIGATMAVFLAGARPAELQRQLLAPGSAYTEDTPAAVVVRATWPDEQVLRTTVGELAATIVATGATRTVLVLVGKAVRQTGDHPAARSHLYSPSYAHAFRKRSRPGTTRGRPAGSRLRSSDPR
jgi:precorrin-4/cobalt-precorrin-4 C11-methyltransferase